MRYQRSSVRGHHSSYFLVKKGQYLNSIALCPLSCNCTLPWWTRIPSFNTCWVIGYITAFLHYDDSDNDLTITVAWLKWFSSPTFVNVFVEHFHFHFFTFLFFNLSSWHCHFFVSRHYKWQSFELGNGWNM